VFWRLSKQDETSRELFNQHAALLAKMRKDIDAIMQYAGDFFNDGDGVSTFQEDVTAPVYKAMEKRERGERLDADD
jgi:hypothetical protein